MNYIDKTFYDGEYSGTPIPDDDFQAIANAAERAIEQETHFLISRLGLENLDAFTQQQIKMAVCAQTEYYFEMGANTEAGMQAVKQAQISGFSYTANDNGTKQISDTATKYLRSTGLLYTGVPAF